MKTLLAFLACVTAASAAIPSAQLSSLTEMTNAPGNSNLLYIVDMALPQNDRSRKIRVDQFLTNVNRLISNGFSFNGTSQYPVNFINTSNVLWTVNGSNITVTLTNLAASVDTNGFIASSFGRGTNTILIDPSNTEFTNLFAQELIGDSLIIGNSSINSGSVFRREGVVIESTVDDEEAVWEMSVLPDQGSPMILTNEATVWKMWHTIGWGGGPVYIGIGYAESADRGLTWERWPGYVLTNAMRSSVIRDGSTYYLYGITPTEDSINRWQSSDGVSWSLANSGMVVLGNPGSWNDELVGNTYVWKRGAGDYHMFYDGLGSGTTNIWGVGYATSVDGISWDTNYPNPVLGDGQGGAWVTNVTINGTPTWVAFVHGPPGVAALTPTDIYVYTTTNTTPTNFVKSGRYPLLARTTADEGAHESLGQIADAWVVVDTDGIIRLYYEAGPNGASFGSPFNILRAYTDVGWTNLLDRAGDPDLFKFQGEMNMTDAFLFGWYPLRIKPLDYEGVAGAVILEGGIANLTEGGLFRLGYNQYSVNRDVDPAYQGGSIEFDVRTNTDPVNIAVRPSGLASRVAVASWDTNGIYKSAAIMSSNWFRAADYNNASSLTTPTNMLYFFSSSTNNKLWVKDEQQRYGEVVVIKGDTYPPSNGQTIRYDSATGYWYPDTYGAGGGGTNASIIYFDAASVNGPNFVTTSNVVYTIASSTNVTITITNLHANQIGTDAISADELNAAGVEAELEAVIDIQDLQGAATAAQLGTDSVSADELNATGVEAELEAVLDLSELQGTVSDSQVPNNITIDLATVATTANAGDSATAFFSAGVLELLIGGTGSALVDPGADRILFWDDSAGSNTWLTVGSGLSITGTTLAATGAGSGDVLFTHFDTSQFNTNSATYAINIKSLAAVTNLSMIAPWNQVATNIDRAVGPRHIKPLTNNIAFTFSNMRDGDRVELWTINTLGSETVAFPTNTWFFARTNAANVPVTNMLTLNTNIGGHNRFVIDNYGGTNYVSGPLDTPDNINLTHVSTLTNQPGMVVGWENGKLTNVTGAASATTIDAIGDAVADGTVLMTSFEWTLSSTLDSANKSVFTIYNTDANTDNDTSFIELWHDDSADANVIYLRFYGDGDGTPVQYLRFDQTQFVLDSTIAFKASAVAVNDLSVTNSFTVIGDLISANLTVTNWMEIPSNTNQFAMMTNNGRIGIDMNGEITTYTNAMLIFYDLASGKTNIVPSVTGLPSDGQVLAYHAAGKTNRWVTPAGSAPSDAAFASSWNGDTSTAPSKNAVYDWGHTFDTDDDGKVDVIDVISAAGFMAVTSGGVPVQGRTLTAGNAMDISNGTGASGDPTFDWDAGEVNNATWGDGTQGTITNTYNVSAGDTIVHYGNAIVNVASGTLQQGGVDVALESTTITVAGTANEITSSAGAQDLSANRTWTLSLPATIDLGGKTSFEIPNAAAPTTDAFGEMAGDNNAWAADRGAVQFYDGTANTYLIGVLASDTPSDQQVPKYNSATGTVTWENDGGGAGSTAINDLGDATADGSVAQGAHEMDFTSTIDAADEAVWTILNTDASSANDNSLIDLRRNDTADENSFYARFIGDNDGTPVNDYLFSQTAFRVGTGIASTFHGSVAITNALTVYNLTVTNSFGVIGDLSANALIVTNSITAADVFATNTLYGYIGMFTNHLQVGGSVHLTPVAGNLNVTNAVLAQTGTFTNALTLNGAGVKTNRVGVVRSFDVPMAGWYTNGVATSVATRADWTNTTESMVFADGATNTARIMFAMPVEWGAGTVRWQFSMGSALTNTTTSTNVVFSLKAGAIPNGGTWTNITFGTAVTFTNHIHRSPFTGVTCVTPDITVGNSPAANLPIVWELTRLNADATDVNTNSIAVVDAQVFFTETQTEPSMPAVTN